MPTRQLMILAAILCAASPAMADRDDPWCQQIWLSRNTVMDRAGQCFSTPLGQAVFDNSDCVAGDRPLSPLDQATVSRLRDLEETYDCAVDTSANRLDPSVLEWRARLMELWTIPIRADTEHGCVGYTGPAMDLHAGMSRDTSVIGRLEPGQNFGFSHEPMPGGWEYITVTDADFGRVAHGWVQGIEMNEDVCSLMAG